MGFGRSWRFSEGLTIAWGRSCEGFGRFLGGSGRFSEGREGPGGSLEAGTSTEWLTDRPERQKLDTRSGRLE